MTLSSLFFLTKKDALLETNFGVTLIKPAPQSSIIFLKHEIHFVSCLFDEILVYMML